MSAQTYFLWGAPPPIPEPRTFNPRFDRWWSQYHASLSISSYAARELAGSSRDIAALLPDPLNWGARPRPFKGLVVGAVQSGKTASMMGVTAVALDQGYRVIIVLAGGKDDLRTQTARRFSTQLLRQSDPIPDGAGATTLGTPRGSGPLGGFMPPYNLDANQFSLLQVRMESALRKSQPCVVVAKKNVASLRDVHSALHHLYTTFGVEELPTLILDDECDDASVDSEDTTIPVAISNLWRRPIGDAPPAVYLGYTATAAANLLQDPTNELYPAHSVYLLRYPGDSESAVQFAEPNPDAWYSGGDCFYRTFGEEPGEVGNFLIRSTVERAHLSLPVDQNPSLLDALRAFFVGGAYRLAADPSRSFESLDARPHPHAMLVQTSAATDEHARWARAIQLLLKGRQLPDKSVAFDPDSLDAQVSADEDSWRGWFEHLDASRERVYQERPHHGIQRPVTWQQVRNKLREVFANTRLKVINSDQSVSGSLDFAARRAPDGTVRPPQDSYVIVVGGSRLSRGLTIEGLCVSYFVRWTPNPTEDTVLQMSRWFGYRGSHLEYCRVFTTSGIADSLRQMHENDMDLRFQLSELMVERKSPHDATLIIRSNPRALPTGKMGTGAVFDLAYSPFINVLRNVETGALSRGNEEAALALVSLVRQRDARVVTTRGGTTRGLISRGWSVQEVAQVLDAFNYTFHNPDREATPLRDFHRDTAKDRQVDACLSAADDPYQIAAYLRAWAGQPQGQDAPLPRFNVGVAFGEMHEGREPFDFALVNREIGHDDRVVGGWTGPGANWEGDAFFDSINPQYRIPGSQKRLVGAEGLLLLYVIHRNARGRAGRGRVRDHHTPMLGISIPGGGPPFRRVVRARSALEND